MYLIYCLSVTGIIPVTTASSMRVTTDWIKENQKNYESELLYMKIGYEWR